MAGKVLKSDFVVGDFVFLPSNCRLHSLSRGGNIVLLRVAGFLSSAPGVKQIISYKI